MTRNLTEHRLGDICRLVKGSYSSTRTEPGHYPLVVTAARRRTAASYDLTGPAVCIPLISSTGHGDAAIHRLHFQDGPFALANLLVALLPLEGSPADAEYLYWYLTAKKDDVLVPLMRGTANVSLKERDIAEVIVPLPPLPEQRRIVARVKGLLGKVEEARGLADEREQLAHQLLGSVFSELTAEAPVKLLADVAPLVRRPIQVRDGVDYPEVGVRSFGRGTFHKPALSALEVGDKKLFEVRAGDLVFNIVFAWEGAVAVAKAEDSGRVGSHRFLTCVADERQADTHFLNFYFQTPAGRSALVEASPGGAGRNRTLSLKNLAALGVPIPSLEEQRYFRRLLEKVEAMRLERQSVASELDALPASILARAFAGTL